MQGAYDLVCRTQPLAALPDPVRILLAACMAFAVSFLLVQLMRQWRPTRLLVE